MKHDKSNRDLNKDINMPGSSGSQGSKSSVRGNLEESEVGASSSSKGNLGSSSGRTGSSDTSSSSSSGSRSGSSSSDVKR